MITTDKKAQEEIVGFALIVIIVSIILVFFLVFSLSDRTVAAESYEAESFLQAGLHYTSSCSENGRYLAVQDLIFSCYTGKRCENEEDSCAALNSTLKDMLKESWPVGSNFPVNGYKIEVFLEEEEEKKVLVLIEEGNRTTNYKGTQQLLSKGRAPVTVLFDLYYQRTG